MIFTGLNKDSALNLYPCSGQHVRTLFISAPLFQYSHSSVFTISDSLSFPGIVSALLNNFQKNLSPVQFLIKPIGGGALFLLQQLNFSIERQS